MVRFLNRGHSLDKLMSLAKAHAPGRHSHSLIQEGNCVNWSAVVDDKTSKASGLPPIGPGVDRSPERGIKSPLNGGRYCARDGDPSEMEMMKGRFAKLLLGEDMSGCGKGVSSALALSNAITNLAASIFGEHRRLEPMSPDRKTRWRKEINWLLSVTDHIVEFVPSQQISDDGSITEIMVTQQRINLSMNIPALRKLDTMLLEYLDNFRDHNEFWYTSPDGEEAEKDNRNDDKWWIPTVKVPPNGLSEMSTKSLQYQKELVNQVLKAAMAINGNVLMEMEIPEAYIESLPKNGRVSLGDSLYRSITDDGFNAEGFLSSLNLSTEHKILDLKNRIEASVVIWNRKMNNKDGKSSWGSAVSLEKREQFEERAETILLILKQRFPGIPQSALDISKIQYNMDVGLSILESYSRILESLASNVVSRIEDVLVADSFARNQSSLKDSSDSKESMTLSDFMDWNLDQGLEGTKKKLSSENGKCMSIGKPPAIETNKVSYIEKLEILGGGSRSPASRH